MEPSLAIIDARPDGSCCGSISGNALRGLSIRHLAVAPQGDTIFGCQFAGDPSEMPALVGVMASGGKTRLPRHARRRSRGIRELRRAPSRSMRAAKSPPPPALSATPSRSGNGKTAATSAAAGCRTCAASRRAAPRASFLHVRERRNQAGAGRPHALAPLGGSELDRWIWDNHVRLLPT